MSTLLFSLALTIGCVPDDVDDTNTDDTQTQDDTGTDDTGEETPVITGDWLSEGEDVSEVLGLYGYVKVDATFNDDGTYTVVSTDGDGATTTFSGTYTADTSTDPHSIVLSQTQPSEATAEGIYAIDGTTMQYEVVQTVPDYGFTAPTPESGFGSTSGPGLSAGQNLQVFQRQ
ncbi:MAG: hypothetical protein VX899_10230 [Myxococcota bacterium]|nr:hypothetical protein [Myxococcota bacterium]